MGISKITRNFQVTIPRDVRKIVNAKEGDEIMFIIEGNKVSISKPVENPIMNAAGIWRDEKESGRDYQNRIRQQWKKRQNKLNW